MTINDIEYQILEFIVAEGKKLYLLMMGLGLEVWLKRNETHF